MIKLFFSLALFCSVCSAFTGTWSKVDHEDEQSLFICESTLSDGKILVSFSYDFMGVGFGTREGDSVQGRWFEVGGRHCNHGTFVLNLVSKTKVEVALTCDDGSTPEPFVTSWNQKSASEPESAMCLKPTTLPTSAFPGSRFALPTNTTGYESVFDFCEPKTNGAVIGSYDVIDKGDGPLSASTRGDYRKLGDFSDIHSDLRFISILSANWVEQSGEFGVELYVQYDENKMVNFWWNHAVDHWNHGINSAYAETEFGIDRLTKISSSASIMPNAACDRHDFKQIIGWQGTWIDETRGGAAYRCTLKTQEALSYEVVTGTISDAGVEYGLIDPEDPDKVMKGVWFEAGTGECSKGTYTAQIHQSSLTMSVFWSCDDKSNSGVRSYRWLNGFEPTAWQCAKPFSFSSHGTLSGKQLVASVPGDNTEVQDQGVWNICTDDNLDDKTRESKGSYDHYQDKDVVSGQQETTVTTIGKYSGGIHKLVDNVMILTGKWTEEHMHGITLIFSLSSSQFVEFWWQGDDILGQWVPSGKYETYGKFHWRENSQSVPPFTDLRCDRHYDISFHEEDDDGWSAHEIATTTLTVVFGVLCAILLVVLLTRNSGGSDYNSF